MFRDSKARSLVTPQSSGSQYYMRDIFGDISLTSNTTRLVIEAVADAGALTGCIDIMVLQDGSFLGNGVEFDERTDLMPSGSDGLRARDVVGLSGSHTYRISNGIKLSTAGLVRQVAIQGIRYDIDASISVAAVSAPTKRCVLDGDSITYNNAATAGSNQSPRAQAWNQLRRATYESGGGSLHLISWGGKKYFDICGDSTKRTAYITTILEALDGTSSNKLYIALGTNDYNGTNWSAANMQTGLNSLVTLMSTQVYGVIPSFTLVLQSPIARTTETANGFGDTCAAYRTAISNVAAAFPAFATYQDGKADATHLISPANLTDGVHINTAGHAEYNTNAPAF
jgi:lysophospholipase L1-like esterase